MTGMVEAVRLCNWDQIHVGLTILAFCVPVGSCYLVNKYLTPAFSRKLGWLEDSRKYGNINRAATGKHSFAMRFSRWFATSPVEQSAFELVYNLLGRDRKIKLKVYPAFGYLLVFSLIFVLKGPHAFGPSGTHYLAMIYLTVMVLQVVIREVPYNDDYKASWIFFSAPISTPGQILSGSLKAILIRLFIPAYMLSSAIVLYVWGATVNIAIDLLFGFFNNCLMLLLLVIIQDHHIPFSLAPDLRSQSGMLVRSLLVIMLVGGLGFIHYLLATWPTVILALAPIQAVAIYVLLRLYRSIPRADLKT
jgi:ABC-2 type transport system permease protein